MSDKETKLEITAQEAAAVLIALDHASSVGFNAEIESAKKKLYRIMNAVDA